MTAPQVLLVPGNPLDLTEEKLQDLIEDLGAELGCEVSSWAIEAAAHDTPWPIIGEPLGISGEAARRRFMKDYKVEDTARY